MRVASPELASSSARYFQAQQARAESLLQRTVTQRLGASQAPTQGRPTTDTASLSEAGRQLAIQPQDQERQVLAALKDLFGITQVASLDLRIDVSQVHAVSSARSERSGSGSYDYQESDTELHGSSLLASGSITLDDGRSFALDLSITRTRLFHSERSVSVTGGSAPDGGVPTATTPADPMHAQFDRLALDRERPPSSSWSALLKSLSTTAVNQRFAHYREADTRLQAFIRSSELLRPTPAQQLDRVA